MKTLRTIASFCLCLSLALPAFSECATIDYKAFLGGHALCGPADLVNESSTETQVNKFTLSYNLVELCGDVVEARIEVYRWLEEGEEDALTWKLERTLSFLPPFPGTIPVTFEGMKRGKLYSIRLSIISEMARILTGDEMPPQEITVKTAYFLWPKDQDLRASIANRFEGEEKAEKFVARWSGGNAPGGYRFQVKHKDGTANPDLGPTGQTEMVFSAAETETWAPETVSAISTQSLNEVGIIIGGIDVALPRPPCPDCTVLPCEPSGEPEAHLLNSQLDLAVPGKFGGSINQITYTAPDGTRYTNLVASGDTGLLCQNVVTKISNNWHSNDGWADANRDGRWEDLDPPNSYSPRCMFNRDEGLFHWQPNQGGLQQNASDRCSDEDGTDEFNRFTVKTTTLGDGSVVTEMKPVHVVAGDNSSPLVYISKFRHWLPLTAVETAFGQQPQAWMDAEMSLIPGDSTLAPAVQLVTRFVLSEDGGPNADFEAIAQDWAFFGSANITRSYQYDPEFSGNCYRMAEITGSQLCEYGVPSCAEDKGWRTLMEGQGKWVPYGLVSTEPDATGKRVWILIYNNNDIEHNLWVRRLLLFKPKSGGNSVPGRVFWFNTLFDDDQGGALNSDGWSEYLESYLIVGDTLDSVMCRLKRLSCGVWPKLREQGCDPCGPAGPCP